MATRAPAANAMTIGSVLARSFDVLGAAPLTLFGTSFLLGALPYALLTALVRGVARPAFPGAVGTPSFGTSAIAAAWPTILAAALVWWLLYLAAKAVLIRTAVATLDRGPATIADHLAAAARVLLPMTALSLLSWIAMTIGFLVLVVPGIILYLIWSVAVPALVAERGGVFAAFGRSARLTQGARWRILGLTLAVWVIYFLAAGVLGLAALMARNVMPAEPALVQTVSSVILQTVFVAIWTTIQAALYVDLRDEKDGPANERLADIFA